MPEVVCKVPAVNEGSEKPKPLRKDLRFWGVAIVALLVGILTGTAVVRKVWNLPPNWGDIPTWLAVVAATAAGWIALSQLRSQQKALQRDAEDRHRAQASQVFIGLPRSSGQLVQPYARNASGLPVFDAQFWDVGQNGLSEPENLGHIMPGNQSPNGRQRTAAAAERVILTFRDADGARWIRWQDGSLTGQARATAQESIQAAL